MKKLLKRIDGFFFRKVTASGFGLMRIAWALTVLVRMTEQCPDIIRYYSSQGIMSPEIDAFVLRSDYRFSLLTYVQSPAGVTLLYLLLLLSCLFMLLGVWPRVSTVVSTLLLFSFHERNLMPLGGGDTVLRCVAFILCLSPGVRAFSLSRLRQQWLHWKNKQTLLAPLAMSVWPWRLLLWQVLIMYGTSAWDKLLGTMWLAGSAVGSTLHHLHFALLPMWLIDSLAPVTPVITYATLLYELLWLLLLIPSSVLERYRFTRGGRLRRFLLLGGVLFHGGIFLFMDVGSFTAAIFTAYLGLLLDEDFAALRASFNRRWRGRIAVLYDGKCRLCRRSIFTLLILDHLHRLEPVDFRDAAARKRAAPDLTLPTLDRSMHIRLPDGTTKEGFYAFRELARHLPVTWLLWPLLYLPGVPAIGKKVYAHIAAKRLQCSHGACNS